MGNDALIPNARHLIEINARARGRFQTVVVLLIRGISLFFTGFL